MRVWALDAGAADGEILRGLEPRAEQAWPDVILLFGGAAAAAAREAGAERQRRDERFLDEAAAWLTGLASERAPRRAPPAPWLAKASVVSELPAARFAPLTVTDRAVELVGTTLLMAIPARDALEREALENALVWIAGGPREPLLEEQAGRALLSPGDFLSAGVRLELELNPARMVARAVDADGVERGRLELSLAPKTKMSVRG